MALSKGNAARCGQLAGGASFYDMAGSFKETDVNIALTGADAIYLENDWSKGGQDYERAYTEDDGGDFPQGLHRAKSEIQQGILRDIAAEEARAERTAEQRAASRAAGAGETRFAEEDGYVTLTHWSPVARVFLDPAKAGPESLVEAERRIG
ncbi:MAG: hypothetical protein K8F31_12175 [Roseovarius sp.]|nr:hypothetical protein [Roseovarius sp.]